MDMYNKYKILFIGTHAYPCKNVTTFSSFSRKTNRTSLNREARAYITYTVSVCIVRAISDDREINTVRRR